MAANALSNHPALRELAGRVRWRWRLRALRRAALVAAAGAAGICMVGRFMDLPVWPLVAIVWTALCLLAGIAVAIARGPSEWTVAREADALGLAERVTSSLHARAIGAPVASLVEQDAHSALDGLDPARYAILDGPRGWLGPGVAVLTAVALATVPLPRFGQSPADAQRVATAQQRVEAMQLQPPTDQLRSSELQTREQAQLQALRDALARSSTSQEAARAIEQAQHQLARSPSSDDYAARRSTDAVAQALQSQPDDVLIPLARALAAHDQRAVEQALADLSSRLDTPGAMTDAQRADAQLALQAAANAAASSQPKLAGDLRKAASALGSQQPGALSDKELQDLLSQDAATSAALDHLEQSVADLGQLGATTLLGNATLVAATGTPTAFALARGTPPPNATPVGLGVAASSAGRGQSTQNGAPGSGASPDGSTPYDPVYAPSHLGGDSGPQVQVGGDASNARGASVDVPQGPVSAGDVRPYDQVYAQYAEEARQSASRQSLPANVQGMVDRYFGAIAPTPGAGTP